MLFLLGQNGLPNNKPNGFLTNKYSCAFQERVIRSKGKDLWPEMLELGFLTHCAYDCPKKHSSTAVLKEAGGALFFGGGVDQTGQIQCRNCEITVVVAACLFLAGYLSDCLRPGPQSA